jgi:hypothetical protein
VAWNCRRVPPISDDLLHHEERIFREQFDQYSIGWSTSVLSAEEIPNGVHVDSPPLSTLFSGCLLFAVELLAGLPVWEPDLFVLIREMKPGFVQDYNIFPAMVLD